jgi:hypothetical protein
MFELMSEVLHRSRADGADRLLLIAIASFTNHRTGKCFPSIDALAALLRSDARNVRRGIARLKDLGDLVVLTGGGRGRANEYRVLPKGDAGASVSSEKGGAGARVSTNRKGALAPGFLRQKGGVQGPKPWQIWS